MNDFEGRVASIEKQLAGIYELLRTMVDAHNAHEKQTLEGFKVMVEAVKSALCASSD